MSLSTYDSWKLDNGEENGHSAAERGDRRRAEQAVAARHWAEHLLARLNAALDDLEELDPVAAGDHLTLGEVIERRTGAAQTANQWIRRSLARRAGAECFCSLNLTMPELDAVQSAVIEQSAGGDLESALAAICRDWLAQRRADRKFVAE